jgi:hypothetical protein
VIRAAELIRAIRLAGGTVRINDAGQATAKGLTAEQLEALRAIKPAMLAYLELERDSVDLDFETRSLADIKKVGAHVYAMHESTEILCAYLARGGGEPRRWLPGGPVPDELMSAERIIAHNGVFEYLIIKYVASRRYGWPIFPLEMFRCTMAKGRVAGLPGNLEKASDALRI